MAECICCGKKLGLLNGSNLDDSLCSACYERYGGLHITLLVPSNNVEPYNKCYQKIRDIIEKEELSDDMKIELEQLYFDEIALKYKLGTGKSLVDVTQDMEIQREKREEEYQKAVEIENKKKTYAKSFNEFYEYDVVKIINEKGVVDDAKMMSILAEHSRNGWRLHTVYSNELGKNALAVLGFGTNTTVCEDVLIFERRIPELD